MLKLERPLSLFGVRSRISLQTDLSAKPEPQGEVSEAKFLLLIRDALYRYRRGVDRCDEAALRSTYWEDATDCHGSWNGSTTGFIEQALAKLRQGGRRVHQITNVLIELRGDVAAVESSFFALQVTGAQLDRETFLRGRYTNRFERREGEWCVASRTVVYDWIEELTRPELSQEDSALFGARQPAGRQAPHDAVYALLRSARAG